LRNLFQNINKSSHDLAPSIIAQDLVLTLRSRRLSPETPTEFRRFRDSSTIHGFTVGSSVASRPANLVSASSVIRPEQIEFV
jgi:hypothetical protein